MLTKEIKSWYLRTMLCLDHKIISKVNNTLIDNTEDLNIVMTMYNLLEYSNNYSMTSDSFVDFF